MKLRMLPTRWIFTSILVTCITATVDHDQIQPISPPQPVTVSEKAAIEYKPQLYTSTGVCASFPAVNAAGEVTGGLKGTNGNDACEKAPLGSQVYGRAGWYKDVWAIMYAWYFPKAFWMGGPSGRHDWKNVVVWINNPALETSHIVGVSVGKAGDKYDKHQKVGASYFVGHRVEGRKFHRTYVHGSNTSLRFEYVSSLGSARLGLGSWDGEYQDLIMWEQLTESGRLALNDNKNFGDAEVPFNDEHYVHYLDEAWPL